MSWIISGIPSITCARVSTWAPASINCATLLPSRAPSRMKSLISATASGWLSLTPRSSRRRATMAAMAISNLSFSRGVKFIVASVEPKPRHACAQRREQDDQIVAQRGAVLGAQPRHRDAAPSRNADLGQESAFGLFGERAHGGELAVIRRRHQHGNDVD